MRFERERGEKAKTITHKHATHTHTHAHTHTHTLSLLLPPSLSLSLSPFLPFAQARAWYVVKEHRPDAAHVTSVLKRHQLHDNYSNSPALRVPALHLDTEAEVTRGREEYERQRQERMTRAEAEALHPMEGSEATLIHLLLPSDCHSNGVAQAGSVLKLMDTAAGIMMVKHCRSNVVTASLEAVDFLHPVFNGDLIEIHAYPVFNSKRSVDVEVNVYTIDHLTSAKRLATRSIFTFVALDEHLRPTDVPPIAVETEAQRVRWRARQQRYEERKAERAKLKLRQQVQRGDGDAKAKEVKKKEEEEREKGDGERPAAKKTKEQEKKGQEQEETGQEQAATTTARDN